MDWYPWYSGVHKADTLHLTLAQEGAYRRLIDHYMETRLPLPEDAVSLSRIVGVSTEEWSAIADQLLGMFVEKGGKLHHKRCDIELEKQDGLSKTRSKVAKAAAEKRKQSQNHACNSQANTERSPGNNSDTRQKKDITTSSSRTSRAHARGNGSAEAEEIVNHFEKLRLIHWPNDTGMAAPRMTLTTQAQDWIDAEVPVQLAYEVMDRVMGKNVADGKTRPPTTLRFCSHTIENALIEYKKTGMVCDRPGVVPSVDREREKLLVAIAKTLSREDIGKLGLNEMTNADLEKLIEERVHD